MPCQGIVFISRIYSIASAYTHSVYGRDYISRMPACRMGRKPFLDIMRLAAWGLEGFSYEIT